MSNVVMLADGMPAEPYQLVRDLEDGSLWRIRAIKENVGLINLLEHGKGVPHCWHRYNYDPMRFVHAEDDAAGLTETT